VNEVEALPTEPFAVFCPKCGEMMPYLDRPFLDPRPARTVGCSRCRLAWRFERPTVVAVVVPYVEPS
jgi:hypothetical protein